MRDDAQMARFHEIVWRAENEDGRPWNPMWTRAEMAALFREPTADARNVGVGAWDAEEPVANLRRL